MKAGTRQRTTMGPRRKARWVLMSGCAGLVALVAPSAPIAVGAAGAATSGSQTPVTIDFTYTWKAEYAPLLLAEKRGYFAKQGISVTFNQGNGSANVFESVAARGGKNTFVIDQSNDLGPAVSEGLPLLSVATFMPEAPDVLVSRTPIRTPKALQGKTVGIRSGGDDSLFFNAFLVKNNVNPSLVHVVNVSSSAGNSAFLTGKVDVVDAFANNELPEIRADYHGGKLYVLNYSRWGFGLLGEGVAVTKAFAKADPGLIRRFLTAETAGIRACKANPNAAAAAIKNAQPTAMPALSIVRKQVEATCRSEAPVAGHQLGWQSAQGWNKTLTVMPIKKRYPNSTYYTNAYLPRKK